MATEAEKAAARALGMLTPTGGDLISTGDDAITENAAAVVRELKKRPLFAEALQYGKKWNSTDDLRTWWHHGAWGVTGAQGMPPGVGSATMIQIEAGNGAWQRLWISFGIDAGIWLQWGNQVAGAWDTPTKLDTSDNLDSALAHELRVQDLQRRRARTTTAKGVVVFVLDHGYLNFRQKCWPDLAARGFPVTWALNTVHPAAIDTGDDQINWPIIKDLAAANPNTLEIAAHSANHGTVIERKRLLETAIIGHKTELETLTGQKVDSWVQPGATLGRFVKDNPGSPDDYANTHAGRMIAATYACATGYIQSPRTFKLDGRPDLGIVGNWLDTGPGNAMTYINNVATNGGYTIVRLHPQYMDQAGYITRTQWQALLDQVKTLVDAGTVEVMTLRDASVATAAVTQEDVTGLTEALNGKSPTGHVHPRIENAAGYIEMDASGGVQHRPGGTRVWWVNSTGELREGTVPVPRVTGLQDRLAALEYDSGLRALTKPEGVEGDVLCKRLGGAVEVNVEALRGATGTITFTDTLPSGMRPIRTIRTPLATGAILNIGYNGAITITGITSAVVWNYGQAMFIPSSKNPPTTLPGSPA